MNLEINKKHKRANITRILSSIMASTLAITLLSGSANPKKQEKPNLNNTISIEDTMNDYDINIDTITFEDFSPITINEEERIEIMKSIKENDTIKVPYTLRKYITSNADSNKQITINDLEKVEQLSLNCLYLTSKTDLIWLNYCTNLKQLKLVITNDDILEYVYNLPNLEHLEIYNAGNSKITLSSNNSKIFLSPNLEYVKIDLINLEQNILNNLTQIKTLDLSEALDFFTVNYDIDYTTLTSLETLIISNPYTIAIRLDSNELETLLNSGVKIVNPNGEDLSKELKQINSNIDSIIQELDIKENDNEEIRFQKLLLYVLNNMEYDSKVLEANKEHKSDINDVSEFYDGGYLYGALNKDTSICGNYSALVSTLCDRLDLNSLIMISKTHAWNLVYVNGYNYYVDATLIDNNTPDKVTFNDMLSNEWYLKDPNLKPDNNHISINLSDMISIEELPTICYDENTEVTLDITNRSYKITFANKEFVVTGAILVGLLGGLGLAYESSMKYDDKMSRNLEERIEKQIKR